MAEIKAAIGRQFQSLSIVFVCAVNTKLASLFRLKFSLQIYMDYMELTGTGFNILVSFTPGSHQQ
jgi:hypothetical protein